MTALGPKFVLVKILDIGFVTCIYFILGTALAILIDRHLGKFDDARASQKTILRLLCELMVHIYLVGIAVYAARNLVPLLPSPYEGLVGFQHARLKELNSATVFTTVCVVFQRHLREKILHVHARLTGWKGGIGD